MEWRPRRLFERALKAEWDGVSVRVIGLADLIANKRAAGHKQDLADVEVLERARDADR